MKISFSPPDITQEEIDEVSEVLRSGWITTGKKTKEFEHEIAKWCHTENAVALNSATSCMEMTLRLFEIGEGDEVIVPAYTYTASASVICHVGATPVMIDSKENSFEMDYDVLSEKINEKTKAIISVDFAGVMCDYDVIRDIVNKKKDLFKPESKYQKALGHILLLADAAHAFGAVYKGNPCGSVADFTSFSFHAVKNVTTAEGGAVVWNKIDGVSNKEIYEKYMLLSLHGQTKDALAKTKVGAWEYDIAAPAYKCNMTDIMAALGVVQLRRYRKLLERRKEILKMYQAGFKDTKVKVMPHVTKNGISSHHLCILEIDGIDVEKRNHIIEQLSEKEIGVNVHYKPLPMFTAYKKLGFDIKDFSNAYKLYERELTVPLHTLLTDEEIQYIIKSVKECL